MLPFTRDDFFQVFTTYNNDIWPLQLVAIALGLAAVAGAWWPRAHLQRAAWAAVACMWIWTGLAYHVAYFAVINPVAYAFGALFVVQGLLLLRSGVYNDELSFGDQWRYARLLGVGLMAFSIIAYPVLGLMVGHVFPSAPSFGVTPCPLTIFSLGLMMMTKDRAPAALLVVPVTWSVIGGTAAIFLGVYEDLSLFIGAIAVLVAWQRRAIDVRDPA